MNEDWTDVIGKRLREYEKPVPDDLWDRIAASLEKKRRHEAIVRWVWRSSAVAAALTIGVFATVKISHRSDAPTAIVAQAANEATDESQATVKQEMTDEVRVVSGDARAKKQLLASSENYRHEIKDENTIPQEIPSASNVEEAPAESMESISEQPQEKISDVNDDKSEEEEVERTAEFLRQAEAEDRAKGKTSHPITVGLSIGSGVTESNSSGVFNPMMYNAGASPYSAHNMDGIATRAENREFARENIYDNASHKRPVRMGVMVNYPLSKVFGIESGVTYSMLNSTFTSSSSRTQTEDSQKLHYIGIPVNLTANIFHGRYFSIYAMAGGMGEKCVSGRVTTSVYDDRVGKVRTTKKNLDVDGLEWSINAAGGLQFNITDFVGIYAEPGVSYHFDSNSNANTIYTDRQFDFALNFGVRFSLSKR